PEGTINDLRSGDTFKGIPQEKRDLLADHIQSQWDTKTRQQAAQTERQWKVLDDAWHRWQTDELTKDTIAATSGQMTLAQANEKAIEWHYTPAQLLELHRAIQTPPMETPSDQDTRQRVMIDVNGARPTLTEAQITALGPTGARKLNTKDTTEALDKLLARRQTADADAREARAETRTVENQQRSILGQEQTQSEQLLKGALGIPPGIIDMKGLTPQVQQAWDLGMQELTNRSAYFQGGK